MVGWQHGGPQLERRKGSVKNMSNELVKWKPVSLAGRKMDLALAKVEPRRIQTQQPEPAPAVARAEAPVAGEPVDVPRWCSVHDGRVYMARYVRDDNGRFRYAQSIKATETLYLGQYAESLNGTLAVPGADLSEETCPWCGASGFGSIRCGKCGKESCYGRTTGRFFRCRKSCGGQGTMVPESRAHEGIQPSARREIGYSTGD